MSEQVKRYKFGSNFYSAITACGREFVLASDYDALQAEYNELESHLIKVQETGAEAYMFAIEDLEDFMRERVEAGKSAVMIKSLTEGLDWVYSELRRVEAECERLREERDSQQRVAMNSLLLSRRLISDYLG